MNLGEANALVERINVVGCIGKPLAVYDGRGNEKPFGDEKKKPLSSDPGLIACRRAVKICIFSGGETCLSGLTTDSL